MSNVKMCDKCHKTIKPKEETKSASRPFFSGKTYKVDNKKTKVKIFGQEVEVFVEIGLKNGLPLDLCHGCGWKIIKKLIE